MRTIERNKDLRLSQNALPEMRARLALLNAAISALQRYQEQSGEEMRDEVSDAVAAATGVRLRPFLVSRRDGARAEKAS